MPSRVTSCPNCGGQVEFKAGTSLLSVCPFCASAVARLGDDIGELEILGKVAPLADLGSPLSIGIFGKHRGKGFTLVGQLQLDYGQGPWNEWYAAFDDGTWGWVAEAQGRAYVTFGKQVDGLPTFREARVGSRFGIGPHEFVVVERRRAEFKAASGELPFAVAPGSHFHYADVQADEGRFGTIDYGTGHTPEALFLGEEVPYDQLFDKSVLKDVAPGQAAAAAGLNCPNCGASVELRAPDAAMRVACGTCGSVLDCEPGSELRLLQAMDRPGPDPLVPLGSVGKFDGTKFTVHGHLQRSVSFDGERYVWEEYLLHGEVAAGYRWLTCADGHWTWVDPVHAGNVRTTGPRSAKLDDVTYRHYQSASARVESLRGEFYWKVAVGERVSTADFIKPPFILSREMAADEVSWSRGRYVEPAEIEQAFKLKGSLPRPFGVAPHQPNPHGKSLKGMLALGGLLSAALLVVTLLLMFTSDNRQVLQQEWAVVPPAVAAGAAKLPQVTGAQVQSQTFKISERTNLALRVTSDVTDNWLFLSGELINLTSNQPFTFGAYQAYSKGSSGGWGKGGRSRTIFMGELPAGEYVLRATPKWAGGGTPPTRFAIEAREDVFIGSHGMVVFFLLWVLPLLKAMQYYSFEKRRWADSDHAG